MSVLTREKIILLMCPIPSLIVNIFSKLLLVYKMIYKYKTNNVFCHGQILQCASALECLGQVPQRLDGEVAIFNSNFVFILLKLKFD